MRMTGPHIGVPAPKTSLAPGQALPTFCGTSELPSLMEQASKSQLPNVGKPEKAPSAASAVEKATVLHCFFKGSIYMAANIY